MKFSSSILKLLFVLLVGLGLLTMSRINETKLESASLSRHSPYLTPLEYSNSMRKNVSRQMDKTQYYSPLNSCSASQAPPPLITQSVLETGDNSLKWCPRRCSCGSVIAGGRQDIVDEGHVVCFPHFLIIGANKAGTSSLYHYLSSHPSIRAAGKKELHYWTFRFSVKKDKIIKYLNNFSGTSSIHHQLSKQCVSHENHLSSSSSKDWFINSKLMLTGEATPDIHYYPIALYRLQIMLPQVKLVLLKRAPFELAFSVYSYNRGKFTSNKNYKKIIELFSLSKHIKSNYSTHVFNKVENVPNLETNSTHEDEQSMIANDKGKASLLMSQLNFEDWISIFGYEVESCLKCRSNLSGSWSKACQMIAHLTSTQPSLYRWHEDVPLVFNETYGDNTQERMSFGGKLSLSNQCWFPPNTHHLNFFGRSAFDKQVELLKQFFPSNQLLVLSSHDLFHNTQQVLNQVIQFLNIDYYEFPRDQLATKLQGPLRVTKHVHPLDSPPPTGGANKLHEPQKPATDHSTTSSNTRDLFNYLHSHLWQL